MNLLKVVVIRYGNSNTVSCIFIPVLSTVAFVETSGPALVLDVLFGDVVVDADLGFRGGVGHVLGLTGAEGLVVLLVAIVERAVGVLANTSSEAGLVALVPVGDVVHVAGFSDLGGHLLSSGERQECESEFHGRRVAWR